MFDKKKQKKTQLPKSVSTINDGLSKKQIDSWLSFLIVLHCVKCFTFSFESKTSLSIEGVFQTISMITTIQ